MNTALDQASQQLGMWNENGLSVPLEGIRVEAELTLPVALTRQTQTYRNTFQKPIEARYVFPVPLDAVLLGLEIRINDRMLHGVVKQKNHAEREYETAIIKGDSAFLLTKLDDGLYQISVGNLMTGEQAEITVTWGETLRWNGQHIRYRLPNLVGPHYGNPQRAGISPENAPANNAAVAYELDVSVLLRGDLAAATVTCPGHAIRTEVSVDGKKVMLDSTDFLDRSFTLQMHSAMPPALVAWGVPDGDNIAVMASCYAPVPSLNDQPNHITLLIDGSGSMAGVSIEQAREAALEIVRSLRDEDTCSLAAFGSNTHVLTNQPLKAGIHRQALLSLCQQLNAELGGTEIQNALRDVMPITPEGGDILMITDGEVYTSDEDVRQFVRHKRRLFTIGVGNAASEKVLRQLSEASGGFCELVSPNEEMTTHIISHFRRLRAPRLNPVYVWPGQVIKQDTQPVIFSGDTAILSARLVDGLHQEMRINMAHSDLKAVINPAEGMLATLLVRLVASRLLPHDNIKLARDEAVHYQLITEHTSMIAVLERDQTLADIELPVVMDVPQMEVSQMRSIGIQPFLRQIHLEINIVQSCHLDKFEELSFSLDSSSTSSHALHDFLEIPELLQRQIIDSTPPFSGDDTDWLKHLNAQLASGVSLQTLLALELFPAQWQQALQPMLAKWPLEKLLLAALFVCVDALPSSLLSKLRPLNAALHQAQQQTNGLENVIAEVRMLKIEITTDGTAE